MLRWFDVRRLVLCLWGRREDPFGESDRFWERGTGNLGYLRKIEST